jgi:hypothetical protein
MIGALAGYSSASVIGCAVPESLSTLGGLLGAAVGKVIPSDKIKVPKPPKKTLEWIKEKIERPEERLLSIVLDKDIKTIQVYLLKKKIRKK